METLPKIKNIVKNKQSFITGGIITIILFGSIFFAGMQYEKSKQDDLLPNQACGAVPEAAAKMLMGEQVDFAGTLNACKTTSDKYEFIVKDK